MARKFKEDLSETEKAIIIRGITIPLIPAVLLKVVGFGSAGVKSGSLAALIQSYIGNVSAGSTFAALQSLGASGALATIGFVAVGTVVVGGATYIVYKKINEDPKL